MPPDRLGGSLRDSCTQSHSSANPILEPAGRSDETEYDLDAHTSLIGKSEGSLVRLQGWFKPAVALAIARSNDGYVATLMGGRTTINNQPLDTRQAIALAISMSLNAPIPDHRFGVFRM